MFGIENINLTFSLSSILFFAGVLLILTYSIYTYIYTVPEVSRGKKILLTFLRAAALLILLFIIFEPVLSLARRQSFQPVNLIFFDNSRSITINDGTSREADVKSFVLGLQKNGLSDNSKVYSFGNSADQTSIDSINLPFNEGNTNFSHIFDVIEESNENISSVAIISDGVITEGSAPVNRASKLNVPVFTLGIGDSSKKNDLLIKDVIYNEYIYAGVSTVISASLLNKGYEGQSAAVSFTENGRLIETQNIILQSDGLQDVKFEYKPVTPGEKKISVTVSGLKDEQSYDNNKKVFFINVLSSKINVLVIAGSPSADLSFIKNSLGRDENLSINNITQIAAGKFVEDINRDKAVDSANIFILIGFPSANTDNSLWDKISRKITAERKPFFIILSASTDFNKLKRIQNELPFVVTKFNNGFTEVLPDIDLSKLRHPMMQSGSENTAADWNNLPPVYMNNSEFQPKPESEVLANVKIRNVPVKKPLIITRKLGSRKSGAILAKDIWRWKLQTAVKGSQLFDSFLMNSLKWLNIRDDQKQVVIRTSKKLYSQGEEIPFTAQVYDASFNPVSDAKVNVSINSTGEKTDIELNPIGSGIYEGIFESSKTGDYSFSGEANLDDNKLGDDNGSFNIGEVDIEMINPEMDYDFLALLSGETKGKFFLPEEQQQLFNLLKQRIERTSDVKIITSEFSLWSNEWLLIFVILFFAAEWFIRKQSGML